MKPHLLFIPLPSTFPHNFKITSAMKDPRRENKEYQDRKRNNNRRMNFSSSKRALSVHVSSGDEKGFRTRRRTANAKNRSVPWLPQRVLSWRKGPQKASSWSRWRRPRNPQTSAPTPHPAAERRTAQPWSSFCISAMAAMNSRIRTSRKPWASTDHPSAAWAVNSSRRIAHRLWGREGDGIAKFLSDDLALYLFHEEIALACVGGIIYTYAVK